MSLSHPHFYSAMASWGRAFDCPVLVHAADREWVQDHDPCLEFWSGMKLELLPGVNVHNFGGHFPGNSILHIEDSGTVLSGDTVLVTLDQKHVSFMWSYPQLVPLPTSEVERLAARFEELDFDTLHSAFYERGSIDIGAKDAIRRSARRHIEGPQAQFVAA